MLSLKNIEKTFLEIKGISLYKIQKEAVKKIIKYGGIEVNTGEGKSIISVVTALTLLNKNKDKKIYIVTVNDYLAKRDYEEMKPIFNKLNIPLGLNTRDNSEEVFKSSVIYTSVNELMFLYLNSILNNSIQIPLDTVIIDEADYTLIDCANVGCTISKGQNLSFLKDIPIFKMAMAISNNLKGEDYIETKKVTLENNVDFYIDRDKERVFLTEKGFSFIEKIFKKDLTNDIGLYSIILNVLKAKFIYEKGVDYIVDNNEIIWIDKNNKRLMKNCKRELPLQIALELKEGLENSPKGEEEISLSYQVFFYLFENKYLLSATLKEVEKEIYDLYKVSIKKIKPRVKSKITLNKELYFETINEQYNAVLNKVKKTLPFPIVLFEENDNKAYRLYDFLKRNGIKTNLLISSNYEKVEDYLIDKAGENNSVLITTPICSRGVDIKLRDYNKYKGLTSIILFNPSNNRILRQIIGRVGRNGLRGEVNKFISLSEDIHLKELSHLPLKKRLIEKEQILRKQLISEKNNRNSEFIIDKLLFDKYNIAIELSRNTNIEKLIYNKLNDEEIKTFRNMYDNKEDLIKKIFEKIYLYYLNTTFTHFKELIRKISNENNMYDISYKGRFTFKYRLNIEFNNYIEDLSLMTIKSLINTTNIKYIKKE